LDECIFSGDKKQMNQIKGFVSETKKKYEAKFVNRVTVSNLSNIIISSNNDSCTSREHDDRRYFCTEVQSMYSGVQTLESKKYFDAINDVSDYAWAYFLYNRDISQFNPAQFPSTQYGRYQKLIGLESGLGFIDYWIKDYLVGAKPSCTCNKCNDNEQGHNNHILGPYEALTFQIELKQLLRKYTEWQSQQPSKRVINQGQLLKTFDMVFGQLDKSHGYKTRRLNESESYNYMNEHNKQQYELQNSQYQQHQQRERLYIIHLPKISTCKNAFANHLKEPNWFTD
jgi:hypothetical protein